MGTAIILVDVCCVGRVSVGDTADEVEEIVGIVIFLFDNMVSEVTVSLKAFVLTALIVLVVGSCVDTVSEKVAKFNPLVTNRLFHPYHLDGSIFIFRGISRNFHSISMKTIPNLWTAHVNEHTGLTHIGNDTIIAV